MESAPRRSRRSMITRVFPRERLGVWSTTTGQSSHGREKTKRVRGFNLPTLQPNNLTTPRHQHPYAPQRPHLIAAHAASSYILSRQRSQSTVIYVASIRGWNYRSLTDSLESKIYVDPFMFNILSTIILFLFCVVIELANATINWFPMCYQTKIIKLLFSRWIH